VLYTYLALLMLIPFTWFYTLTMIAGMVTIVAPVVHLMYFIKFYLNGKHENTAENLALCRVTYIKLALDCLCLVWVGYSCSSLMSFMQYPSHGASFFGITVGYVTVPESMALIAGRKFGKHNFSYFISPKKTWEGFVGQYLGVIAGHIVVKITALVFQIDFRAFDLFNLTIIGLSIITVSILGDLIESIMKRAVDTKDSSGLFYGLGGSLDKFDSLGVTWILMPLLVKLLIHIPEGNLL
jgi:phosphatidate cytidylyltransferase